MEEIMIKNILLKIKNKETQQEGWISLEEVSNLIFKTTMELSTTKENKSK